jgi:hypothetical protein
MQSCQVCGRSFDPLGFQVVVPELGRAFDRIECAQSARASAGPAARIAAVPLVAPAQPLMAAALAPAVPTAAAARGTLVPVPTTLGLLAAGTAAAVVLWVNVLGADPSSFSLGPFNPPPAFGHQTIQAEVAPAPTPPAAQGTSAEQPATVTVEKVVFVPSVPPPLAVVAVAHRGNATPAARPGRFTTAKPTGKSSGKGHAKGGKGHAKHSTGNGKGKSKH